MSCTFSTSAVVLGEVGRKQGEGKESREGEREEKKANVVGFRL